MRAEGPLGLRIPGRHRHSADRCAAMADQRLDGVAFFLAVRAVVADAALGSGCRVLGQPGAVGKDQQRVAAGRLLILDDGEAQTRLGQQARDEAVVGLSELGDVRARAERRHAVFRAGGEAPCGIGRIRRQHLFEDVRQRPVLEHLAVALLGGEPEPRHHGQAIAREAAIGAELLGLPDQAGAPGLRAVGQRGDQRHALADERFEGDARVGADRYHPPLEQLGQRLAAEPCLHRQFRDRAFAFQRVQAVRGGEEVLQQRLEVHARAGGVSKKNARRIIPRAGN